MNFVSIIFCASRGTTSVNSPFRISPPAPLASGVKIFTTQVGDPFNPMRFSSASISLAVRTGI